MASQVPLILIPGLLCTRELWTPQIAGLAAMAEITVADHTRHDTMAGIVQSILTTAPPRFALAGLSMGGYIAFELMRTAPGRVERLCLLDTSARPDTSDRPPQRRALVAQARGGMVTAFDGLFAMFVHPDHLGDLALRATARKMMEDVGPDGFARQTEAIIGRADSRPTLPQIACPTHVIVGRQDALTPLALHEEIAAGIPGAQLRVIETCGHLSTLEQPAAVTQAMAEWLQA